MTAPSEPEGVVVRALDVGASRDRVWALWTDPDRIVEWMGKTATIDLRRGGEIRIEYANGAVMLGSVVEVDAPGWLVLTWGWEDPAETVRPGGSRVEVHLDEAGNGTRVRLRHVGLSAEEATSHAEGWDYFLGRLAGAAR